ncbi:hypothetical protein ACFL5Z_00755 [Planctomycetota bacterium]
MRNFTKNLQRKADINVLSTEEQLGGMGFESGLLLYQESEMVMSNTFFILALASTVWGVVSSIVITAFLARRGVKINYVFIKVLILKYVHQYRKIIMQENGRPGPWFYSFVVSMNLALVLVIVGIILMKV